MDDVDHQIVRGIHLLRYPDQSLYVPVAERVRQLYKSQQSFSVERGAPYHLRGIWFYRAWITVGTHQFIGDAEIHFGAALETPDGTNPITCGQTSAIGNALTFAGFGDVRSILERQGEHVDAESEVRSPDASHQVIEGIEVVMLDGSPYVAVAERLRLLHLMARPLCIESCTIQESNGVWVYRATILVDGKRFVGDAEIFFDAPDHSIDQKYPISSAQTSAVGTALAYAGFGDVHSILHWQGKSIQETTFEPKIASADAVIRARQYAKRTQNNGPVTDRGNGSKAHTGSTAGMTRGERSNRKDAPITPIQRERLRMLCERLGEAEPARINEMTEVQAARDIARFETQYRELFEEIEAVVQEQGNGIEPSAEEDEDVNYTVIRTLRRSWVEAYHLKGSDAELWNQWRHFKMQICGVEVDDDHMRRSQYDRLVTVIEQQGTAGKTVQGKR